MYKKYDDYDHRTLKEIKGTVDSKIVQYQDCLDIIYKKLLLI